MTSRRLAAWVFGLVWLTLSVATEPANGQCDLSSIGSPPLNDLGPGDYQPGTLGGLYPAGANRRPAVHDAAGIAIATGDVTPRDASGAPSPSGLVGMISIGMSNTTQEFNVYLSDALADPSVHSQLVIVDGAQGGQAIEDWLATPQPLSVLAARVANAGLTPEQVQVMWMKHANRQPSAIGLFPIHAESLKEDYEGLLAALKLEYPNLRLAYLSSRTRAGVFDTGLNPEPFAYESAFAVRWAIEDQLNGVAAMEYAGATPVVPWTSWGPYIWTDGDAGRSDGLFWEQPDLQGDCTHPATSGRQKVADQLTAFFKTDPTTTSWYLAPTDPADAPSIDAGPTTITGAAPLTVVFAASATAADPTWNIDEFAWDFDDGCYGLGANRTKTFVHPGTYTVRLTVTDDQGHSATEVIMVDTDTGPPVAPSITGPTSPLPDGTADESYSTTFAATGTAPLTWSVVAGTLPPGMNLEPNGSYHGVPDTVGTYNFTVEVTNAVGTDSAVFAHTIEAAGAGGDPVTLNPIADAYVRDGSFSSQNFGDAPAMAIRSQGVSGQMARGFLKFDVGSVVGEISTATLRLRATQTGTTNIGAHSVDDDSWTETALTFVNQPTFGASLDTTLVDTVDVTYEWDVTTGVIAEHAGDGIVSLCLRDPDGGGGLTFLATKEGVIAPELVLTFVVEETLFTRGDCNNDGGRDVADAVHLLSWLFPVSGAPTLDCADACDANDDGNTNLADAVAALSALFGSPPAVLPEPSDCGVDPTVDGLGCASFGCP